MADFVVGDTNSELVGTLLRRDGTLFDLTGFIVNLRFRIGSEEHITAGMEILAPSTSGRVRYRFTAADLDRPGILYTETKVVDPGTLDVVSSSEVLEFLVRDNVSNGSGAGLPTAAVEFYKSAPQIVPSGALTTIGFDNVTYNVGGFPDPLDTGSGILVSSAGRYIMGADLVMAPVAGGNVFIIFTVTPSGGAASQIAGFGPLAIVAEGTAFSVAFIHTYNIFDMIHCKIFHNAGADRTVNASADHRPRFWAHNLA